MKTEKRKANINDYVWVRLTEEGHEIYNNYYKEINDMIPNYDVVTPKLDTDEFGYSRFQLWWFMQVFGKHFHIGFGGPCETEVYIEVHE